jgi:GNAT superfamily N-acetyltransferase
MLGTLTLREGYFGDRTAFKALADLLQDIFGIDISVQMPIGGPDPTSMPFGYFDSSGRCVANFSVFSMPLTVNGRVVMASGYQSGAVRPEYRGKGLYRDLMKRAFAWADAQGFEAGILLTDKLELYRPFGFRVVPQSRFCGTFPSRTPGSVKSRDLDLATSADVALVSNILANREPVSRLFAVQRQSEMFLLNALFDPEIRLSYLPTLGAIIAWKIDRDTLQILDIAAREIPRMSDIGAALGATANRVDVLFPTDRLSWTGEPQPYTGSCALMVRGIKQSTLAKPVMLSPMADF